MTTDEEWPRAVVVRGRRRRGVRYFGPYAHAYAIRETLDLLLRSFPVRTCSPGKFRQHERLGRPCLLFHIEKCAGPCVGEVTAEDYSEMVEGLCRFLGGDTEDVVRALDAEMREVFAVQQAGLQKIAEKQRDRVKRVGVGPDYLRARATLGAIKKEWRGFPAAVDADAELKRFARSSVIQKEINASKALAKLEAKYDPSRISQRRTLMEGLRKFAKRHEGTYAGEQARKKVGR